MTVITSKKNYELDAYGNIIKPGLDLNAKKLFYTLAVCINFMGYVSGHLSYLILVLSNLFSG